ncbi:MAG: hypothetical protein ABJP48_08775 [Erythrobacter sp.]
MSPTEILFIAGAIVAGLIFFYLAITNPPHDNAHIGAAMFAGFFAFSAVTIYAEGPLGFLANHNASLWGVQVWYDLIIALGVALVFVAPRAREAGMNVWVYVILTGCTGSIGLLAMVARLFWLERQAAGTKTS